jgi:hypothetical protein
MKSISSIITQYHDNDDNNVWWHEPSNGMIRFFCSSRFNDSSSCGRTLNNPSRWLLLPCFNADIIGALNRSRIIAARRARWRCTAVIEPIDRWS